MGRLPPLPPERQIGRVTDPNVHALPFPDATARRRIESDLDVNLLVEAGAGSGKTTALVARMVALVTTGSATVDQIAAVTFTRKAASELRERFQAGVEEHIRLERGAAEPDVLVLDRLTSALDEIDRAFIGTIHSFCGRLLRERPLEIGLDPDFQELPVEERALLRKRAWESYLERLARESDPILEDLARAGLRPSTLFGLFCYLVENPDVDFPADAIDPPSAEDVASVRSELEQIVEHGWELMDDVPSSGNEWDSLQKKIRQLHFQKDVTGWTEDADLFEAIALLCKPGPRGHDPVLKRWRQADLAKLFRARVDTFGVGDTPAQGLVNRWYAHRYALAIRLGLHAVEEFAAHRLRIGKLDFQDLLVLAARLLKSDRGVRKNLGERYRRLLVDEFQDTDPLQAEIMLLLSSPPPESGGEPEVAEDEKPARDAPDWRTAVPRPGALFVVGDPKQSIYRFRRADIQLYGFVKGRFSDFGEVLTLSTNFRSRPAIGDLVNELFSKPGFLPPLATPEQAAFERLAVPPPSAPVSKEGVYTYQLAPDGANKDSASEDDAARIATWIRDRVDSGERVAGDFLILTRGRGQLSAYARALEARSLPLQVTGAGVGVEEEIREVEVLVECMIDPSNAVKVVSALVGLFFGLDYERLVAHRLDGGGLDVMSPGDRGHPDVLAALRVLNGWWRASVSDPADVFIARLVSELGVLPYSAAGDLGTLRAGALLYSLEAVRAATLAGAASLPGALAALSASLDLKEAEAPFEPGRPDAVRLMNLHQAKGLESTVVILADPTEHREWRPELHLTRSEDGVAEGYLRVTAASTGRRSPQDLARPMQWEEYEAAERRFERAEEVRLLYVAVTRAREELVVAQWPGGRGSSAWAALDPWLTEHATLEVMERREPPERAEITMTPEEAADAVGMAAATLTSMRTRSYEHTSVTALTKTESKGPRPPRAAVRSGGGAEALRGFSWGSAVHGALAVAVADPSDEHLRSACRDLLVEYERPLDDHGEPTELYELLGLVRSVARSDLWVRAQAAEQLLSEIPFAASRVVAQAPRTTPVLRSTNRPSKVKRQLDLFAPRASDEGDAPAGGSSDSATLSDETSEVAGPTRSILEGVVDLAFREVDGWVIADYKTDVGTDPDFAAREEGYRRQVDLYADAWARLTGEPVKERVLFFTAQDRVESW